MHVFLQITLIMQRYALHPQFGEVMKRLGVPIAELLRSAGLPEDLLTRPNASLAQADYFRFLDACSRLLPADDTIIRLATSEHIETMLPPVYAAYCGNNGLDFLHRFSKYKRLAVPMKIMLAEHDDKVDICIMAEDDTQQLPAFFVELAILFLTGVLRNATEVNISPIRVETTHEITNTYVRNWLKTKCVIGRRNVISFLTSDLNLPFNTQNDALLEYMEPELRRRLSEMEANDSMSARVSSVLVELLPKGKSGLDSVAERLYMSRRTLQRKLTEEGTSFQQLLADTRFHMAQNYISQLRDCTSDELAFLLGYTDTNAFLRAFSAWSGMSVTEYKKKQNNG